MQVNGTTLVSEKESGPTQLWHQCLGHMSEKGLQVLMNRNGTTLVSEEDPGPT